MTDNKRIILVLGMHRSGTSALTRAVVALGAYSGEHLLSGNYYNQTGYWEDQEIVALNDRLLSIFDHAYDSLHLLPEHFIDDVRVQALKTEARDLLTRKLMDNAVRVIKDPRMCRLLSFWQPIFADLNIRVDYVIAVRHPLSVAASLLKRDQFSIQKSLLLWLQHNALLLSATQECARFFIHYDDFLAHPNAELMGLARDLGVDQQPDLAEHVEDYVQNFLTADLRHSQFQLSDLKSNAEVPESVLQTYELLLSACQQSGVAKNEAFIVQCQDLLVALKQDNYLLRTLQSQSILLQQCHDESKRVMTTQIYWHSPDHPAYVHINRIDARCLFSEQVQVLAFDFPLYTTEVKNLRFDLADCPAFVTVQAFCLLDSDQQIIWQWSGDSSIFAGLSGDLQMYTESGAIPWFISTGEDPYVILHLPEEVLVQITSGWVFTVDIIIRPLSIGASKLLNLLKSQSEQLNTFKSNHTDYCTEVKRADAQLAFLRDIIEEM